MKTVKQLREILAIKNELVNNDTNDYDAYDMIEDIILMAAQKLKCTNNINEIIDVMLEDDNFMDKYAYELANFVCHVWNTDEALDAWKRKDD